ncbi:response regulator [Microvirga sp. BT689]|nr:response regulator [Microvirga arvi]
MQINAACRGWRKVAIVTTAGFTMTTITGPVIVVDDDAAVRQSLKFALEQEGFEVRLYEDGAQLLADGALPLTGCLVVDLTMPGM